jgi:hypothetical protein
VVQYYPATELPAAAEPLGPPHPRDVYASTVSVITPLSVVTGRAHVLSPEDYERWQLTHTAAAAADVQAQVGPTSVERAMCEKLKRRRASHAPKDHLVIWLELCEAAFAMTTRSLIYTDTRHSRSLV